MKPLIDPDEIKDLAPMPASVARLARIACDASASALDIAEIIQYDEALAAGALRLANSAWAGARRTVDNVKDAVVRIGVGRVLQMAVGTRVNHQMDRALSGYGLGEHELWRHSVAAALAAEKMNSFAKARIPAAAFAASLLHDIGKLVIARHLGDEVLKEITALSGDGSLSYVEAERRVLGTGHPEVGGAMARQWGFPEPLVLAVERHHEPNAQPDPLLDVVHVANAVAKLIGVGLGREQMNMNVSSEAARRLGISQQSLESLCASVLDGLDKAEETWRVG